MRRGAIIDERIREISFSNWKKYVDEFIEIKDIDEIKSMQKIMDDIYMGMIDEYYGYFDIKAKEKITAADSGFVLSWDFED